MRVLALILMLVLGSVNLTLAQDLSEEDVTRISSEVSSTIEIIAPTSVSITGIGNGLARCTGVVLDNRADYSKVLTAKHCVGIFEEMYVEDNAVIKIRTSVDDDLAVLTVQGYISGKKAVVFSPTDAKKHDIVYIFGYPSGDTPYIKIGYINLKSRDWQFAKIESIKGCSGGGVYNVKGELVGILWGGNGDRTVLEPISDVKNFLKQ